MAVPASVLPRTARTVRSRKPQDDGDSLLKSLGKRTLSGLAAVGNALDLPGSMVRDALAGENPFDQWMSPLTDENRVGGRELMERYGVLGKNRKGIDAGDFAGFAGEIALDPLSYLGGVGLLKSFGKGGAVLGKASKDLSKLSRVKRMTTTVSEAAKNIAPDALEHAVQRSGYGNVSDFMARHGDEPVGGLLSLHSNPFGGPLKALGTGATAQKIGGALDKVGEAARYGKIPGTNFSPGAAAARTLRPSALGLHTSVAQKSTSGLRNKLDTIERTVKSETARDAIKMLRQGHLTDEASDLGRMWGELGENLDFLPESEQQLAKLIGETYIKPRQSKLATLRRKLLQYGSNVNELNDPAGIKHVPRQFLDVIKNSVSNLPREDRLQGFLRGTQHVREIIADPKIREAATFEEAQKYFEDTYGEFFTTLAKPTAHSSTPGSVAAQGIKEIPLDLKPQAFNKAAGLRDVQLPKKEAISELRPDMKPGQLRKAAGLGDIGNKELIKKLQAKSRELQEKPVEVTGNTSLIKKLQAQSKAANQSRGTPGSVTFSKGGVSNRQVLRDELLHRIREVYTPDQLAVGGYGQNVLLDLQDATIGMQSKLARLEAMPNVLKDAVPVDQLAAKGIGDSISIADIAREAGLELETTIPRTADDVVGIVSQPRTTTLGVGQDINSGFLMSLADAMGLPKTRESLRELSQRHLPVDVAEDAVRLLKGDDIKTNVGPWFKAMDSFTNLFKVGVLNWPARYVRDHVSGQLMNMLTGNWSYGSYDDAARLVAGGVQDFTQIPIVEQLLSERGLEATAENSTDIMRELLYGYDIFTGQHGRQGAGEVAGKSAGVLPGKSDEFSKEFVGVDPLSLRHPSTLGGGSTMNPFALRGVGDRIHTDNYIYATGERAGKLSDGLNRIVPFIENLKKGVNPDRAKEIVDAIQVNYAPQAYTAAERKYLKRLFPFYSFQSRITKTVFDELMSRPGGGIGQTIRASNKGHDDSGPIPEHLSKSLSVPLGQTSDGSTRYLTGLGLMHEAALDPFAFRSGLPDVESTLSEIGGKTHPLLKSVIELSTGRSLFQQRDIEDLDPAIGRTLSNLGDLSQQFTGHRLGLPETLPSGKAKPFISPTFENLAANTPLSRVFTTMRTLTDPRKREATGGMLDAFPGQAMAMNLLSGLRVSDLSPRVQRGIMIDELARLMKERGAQEMSTVRFRKAEIEQARERDPEMADQMVQLNSVANQLLKDAKTEAKARKAAKK